MLRHLKIVVVFLAVGLAIGFIGIFRGGSLSAQEQKKPDRTQYPIADYETRAPLDPKTRALKKARGARYSRGPNQQIRELPLDVEELPLISHGWASLPALPVDESDAVVVGEVANAHAFLSNDKTAVYSEFTVRVEDTLKCFNSSPIAGETVVIERSGGAVRFPSGRIQYYSVNKQGLPSLGSRYVFFLKRNDSGDDFSILTAYELRDGRVHPVDGAEGDKGSKLVFEQYEGYDVEGFLKLIQEAATESRTAQIDKGQHP